MFRMRRRVAAGVVAAVGGMVLMFGAQAASASPTSTTRTSAAVAPGSVLQPFGCIFRVVRPTNFNTGINNYTLPVGSELYSEVAQDPNQNLWNLLSFDLFVDGWVDHHDLVVDECGPDV